MPYQITDGITQTILTTFLQCPQKCRYLLDGLYDPTRSENFRKGTLGHLIMESIYKDHKADVDAILDTEYEKAAKEVKEIEKLNSIFGIFEALIKSYQLFYKKDFLSKIKYTPEAIFDLDFLGFRLRGKTDLTFNKCIMEHKFLSQISEDKLVYVLSLDLQTNFYAFVYKLIYGKYPDKIFYNVIRVPGNKIKEAETSRQFAARLLDVINKDPKYYFRRLPVVPSKRLMEMFEKNLCVLLARFKMFLAGESAETNLMSCCPGLYLCEYASICVSGSKAGFKNKPLFQELK